MARNIAMLWDPAIPPPTFPLGRSASGRYYQTPAGVPFLLNIAAGTWMYPQAISNADFEAFATTLKGYGFNTLHMSLISNDVTRYPSDSGNHFAAPNWNDGTGPVPPFLTPGDYATPNPDYFAHGRSCVDFLKSIDMQAIVQASYLGYLAATFPYTTSEGWGQIMLANTDASMTSYGVMAGTLLLPCQNVFWGMGGDARPAVGSALESRVKHIVDGVISVDPDKDWIAHWDGDTGSGSGGDLSFDQATFESYPQLVGFHYGYNPGPEVYTRIRTGWQHTWTGSTPRPQLIGDESYENDPQGTPVLMRAKTMTGMCEGACGMVYARGSGSPDGWAFSANVDATTGTVEHGYMFDFWSALPWWEMEPDIADEYVIAGRGSYGSSTYVCARGSANCCVAFLRNGAASEITLDMSKYGGPMIAAWFDPTTGSLDEIGTFPNSSTQDFTQPAARGDGTSDYALLLVRA